MIRFHCPLTPHTFVKGAVCFPALAVAPERLLAPGQISLVNQHYQPLRVYYLRSPQSDNKCTRGKKGNTADVVRVSLSDTSAGASQPRMTWPPWTLRSRVEMLGPASLELTSSAVNLTIRICPLFTSPHGR